MNKKQKDSSFILERMIHHAVMLFTGALIVFGFWSAYKSTKAQNVTNIEMPISSNGKGVAKPLPDFIVDKIKPDELEQLKP